MMYLHVNISKVYSYNNYKIPVANDCLPRPRRLIVPGIEQQNTQYQVVTRATYMYQVSISDDRFVPSIEQPAPLPSISSELVPESMLTAI